MDGANQSILVRVIKSAKQSVFDRVICGKIIVKYEANKSIFDQVVGGKITLRYTEQNNQFGS